MKYLVFLVVLTSFLLSVGVPYVSASTVRTLEYNSAFPSGWSLSLSSASWSESWGADTGVGSVHTSLIKGPDATLNERGRALKLSSRNPNFPSKSSLIQLCKQINLGPGSYKLSASVRVLATEGEADSRPGIIIQESGGEFRHYHSAQNAIDFYGKVGQWQDISTSFTLNQNDLRYVDGVPRNQICLQAINNAEVVFDSIKIETQDQPPHGYVDSANCGAITGWALDPDDDSVSIDVDLWLLKDHPFNSDLPQNIFLGKVVADENRQDLPSQNKNHGFRFELKNVANDAKSYLFKDLNGGKPRSVTAFAINIAEGGRKVGHNVPLPIHNIILTNSGFEQVSDSNNGPLGWFHHQSGSWNAGWCNNHGAFSSVDIVKKYGNRSAYLFGIRDPSCGADQSSQLVAGQSLPPLTPGWKYGIAGWIRPGPTNVSRAHFSVQSSNTSRMWGGADISEGFKATEDWHLVDNTFIAGDKLADGSYDYSSFSSNFEFRIWNDDRAFFDNVRVYPVDHKATNLFCDQPTVPPTATPVPPTATPVPPTATPVPPVDPTATPVPQDPVCSASKPCPQDNNECTVNACVNPGTASASCVTSNRSGFCNDRRGICENGACQNSQTNLSLTVSLDGVPYREGSNAFHPQTHGRELQMLVILSSTTSASVERRVPFVYDEASGTYTTKNAISYTSLIAGPYSIIVKGPRHLGARYCRYGNRALSVCTFNDLVVATGSLSNLAAAQADSFIWLQNGTFNINLSQKSILAGDLPISGEGSNTQDGKVNVTDYSFMISCLGGRSRSEGCVAKADVDFSGQVNNIDLGLLRKALGVAFDPI